jgi:hypothetical protein
VGFLLLLRLCTALFNGRKFHAFLKRIALFLSVLTLNPIHPCFPRKGIVLKAAGEATCFSAMGLLQIGVVRWLEGGGPLLSAV